MAGSDGGDIRERLSNLWEEFGLTPDVATAAAQHQAAAAVDAWLNKGKEDPEIAIRAAQVLLVDPERPGANKRPAWIVLRNVLTESWPNAATAAQNISYAQAMLLAVWPSGAQEGWLDVARLFDSARLATVGSKQHHEALRRWRGRIGPQESKVQQLTAGIAANAPALPKFNITAFGGLSLPNVPGAIQHIQAHQGHPQWSVVGQQVVQVLQDYQAGLASVSKGLKLVSEQAKAHGEGLASYVGDVAERFVSGQIKNLREEILASRCESDLLWWGQARYCHAMAIPYRRLARESAESALWWASYEAAKLSQALETEPAAAYLVETLDSLGQDVFEKKKLIQWIEGIYAVLQVIDDKAPPVCKCLATFADGDALGLPVTWLRLRAARKEPLTGVANIVALDLETEIDRGEWASWIFREILLDLHLAGDS